MGGQTVPSATGGTTGAIDGITRVTIAMNRTVSPVHFELEPYAQCAARGGWACTGTLEGVDADNLLALEDLASQTLTVILEAAEVGGTIKTFVIQNVIFHSFSQNSGDPGDPSSSSISWEALSADGSTAIVAIS